MYSTAGVVERVLPSLCVGERMGTKAESDRTFAGMETPLATCRSTAGGAMLVTDSDSAPSGM